MNGLLHDELLAALDVYALLEMAYAHALEVVDRSIFGSAVIIEFGRGDACGLTIEADEHTVGKDIVGNEVGTAGTESSVSATAHDSLYAVLICHAIVAIHGEVMLVVANHCDATRGNGVQCFRANHVACVDEGIIACEGFLFSEVDEVRCVLKHIAIKACEVEHAIRAILHHLYLSSSESFCRGAEGEADGVPSLLEGAGEDDFCVVVFSGYDALII